MICYIYRCVCHVTSIVGEPKMIPKHVPTFEGEDAKKFIEQDKKPLSSAQRKHLEKCVEIYEKNPIK